MSNPSKRDVTISKALSYLLRHGAVKEGLTIDSLGYVPLNQVLEHKRLKSLKATGQDVERIVANNDKKRFTLMTADDGQVQICANQGHSLKSVGDDNLQLVGTETVPYPKVLIHGTTKPKAELIVKTGGLSKMNRNHVHFTDLENTVGKQVSGIRGFSTVLIYIDIDKFKKSGLHLYKSLNNVYLSPGNDQGIVPSDLFQKIVDRSSGEAILL